MGFWLGTFMFILFEALGFAAVHFTGKTGNNQLMHTLVATTVICLWLMWAIVYVAQMHPLINPILQG